MPYSKEVVTAANTAARDYVQGGTGYHTEIYSAADALLVSLPMASGTINGTTGALTWQGSGAAAAVATGAPSYAVVVREGTTDVQCITLPVQNGSTPVSGVCVISLSPFEIETGTEYLLDSITVPGV